MPKDVIEYTLTKTVKETIELRPVIETYDRPHSVGAEQYSMPESSGAMRPRYIMHALWSGYVIEDRQNGDVWYSQGTRTTVLQRWFNGEPADFNQREGIKRG